ncbi:GDSL esterase/lipase EXL1-like [Senna tora]|uniref:GDSL esterase/lipase EXL1-like n=1 Tax=Senna tora TaxID=362788 RepID=A0A834T936_9FABA|nr:GDSL esterase/lipase EXL1-like [Senna tora]
MCWKTKGVVKLPANLVVPAVFALGDSIMDTGNNNNLLTPAKCNYPPYGKDFEGGLSTGRCCNGKVPSDLVVEELGIKTLLPPYSDPNLTPQDLATGVCFASSAAGYDPATSALAPATSMLDQVKLFKEYAGKLKGVVGEERANFILTNGVVLVVAGSDDIANTYYGARFRQLQFDVAAYTDFMVKEASDIVKGLYEAGARRIGVFSAPPIGCVPSQRTLAGGIQRDCAHNYNDAAKLFNSKLANQLQTLQHNFPNATFRYIDVYNPLLDIILNYNKYGFKVVDRGCCGTGIIEVAELCNHLVPTCPNNSDYVFWDSFHPTEAAYRKLIPPIIQKYVDEYSRGIGMELGKAEVKLVGENMTVTAVLVLGDSIMDTGNNNNNMKTLARCNFRPYGKDFHGGIPTGRFGNGKVPSDLIVEELGIKELLPAYLDPNLQPGDLATGVCFASGGTGYDPLTPKLASAISLWDQVELLKEYIVKLEGVVGESRRKFIISNSVAFVVAGSNDISNTYFLSHARQVEYDVPAYTDFMVASASNLFNQIYALGIRRIGVLSAPPIGCVPFQRTLLGGLDRGCARNYNDAAQLFNSKLQTQIASLNRNFPDARFVYIDVYNPLLDIILNYQNYGFKVPDRGCCGTGELEVAFLCNHLDHTCPHVFDYVFWDSFHPTETVYRKLIPPILQKYLHRFF